MSRLVTSKTRTQSGLRCRFGAFVWQAAASVQRPGAGRAGRALPVVPLYHKNAMAGAVKPLLPRGGSVVVLPNFEPVRILRTLSGNSGDTGILGTQYSIDCHRGGFSPPEGRSARGANHRLPVASLLAGGSARRNSSHRLQPVVN